MTVSLRKVKMDRHYPVNGKNYPSVTTILNHLAKPALYFFYAKHGLKKAQEISKESTDLGTAVHLYISKFLTEHDDACSDKGDKFNQCIANFIKFYDEFKPEVVEIEKFLCNTQYEYAGTADAILRIGNKKVLIDWKTSKAVYEDYELQAEAYSRCDDVNIDEMWIVRLDPLKKINLDKDIRRLKQDDLTYKAFLGLKTVYDWKHKEN